MANLEETGLYGYGAEIAITQATYPGTGAEAQGAWIKDGLILAGGDQEPYLYVVRRGGQKLSARFGMAAEMPD